MNLINKQGITIPVLVWHDVLNYDGEVMNCDGNDVGLSCFPLHYRT